MNFYVLSWLLFFLAPGGCPIYSIDLATLEVPTNDFQNELTLQSMLSSELRAYRNGLNGRIDEEQQEDPPYAPPRRYQQPEWLLKDLLPRELQKATRSAAETDAFLGTNLFGNYRKNCFSTEDIALISARKDFELLVPKSFPHCLLTDSIVNMLLRYFNTVNQIVKRMSDDDTRLILQRALYDALGGYLRYYLVPMAQVSYYAGRIKLNTVERLVTIYRQCRTTLNTNGNGWRTPNKDIMTQFKGTKIEPVNLPKSCQDQEDASSCAELDQSCIIQEPDQGSMLVPLPRVETPDESGLLSNIYLPFRKRRIYNLRSPRSACVLVKFFQTLTSCHRFQGISQVNYNRQLLAWLRENLQMHYGDELFYPGLGGVLQIQERLVLQQKNPEEESRETRASLEQVEEWTSSLSKEDSRKMSRSAIHWQEAPDSQQEQEHQDEWLTGLEKVHTRQDEVEECRECDNDDTLIWCIAAFLALLLLLILLIICCCMRRGRKKKVVPTDAEAPPPKEKKKKVREPVIVTEPVKESGKEEPEGDRRYYYSGSGRSTSQRSVQNDRDPGNPEIDSYTSTSSLGCQFNKKCVPLKFNRTKGEEYYIPDKSRDEVAKPLSTFKLLSEDSSSHRPLRPPHKPALKATQSAIPTSESDLIAMDKDRRRQKQSRQEEKRKSHKDTKTSRRKETKSSEESRKQSSSERRTTKQVRIATDNDSTDDPLLHRKKSSDKPEPSSGRLRGGTESVKDSPSWETTFDDI
ncbi:uncharacterized protein LOC119550304 isoform X2 [Drosophila subpulchrella]|uniref:uncharacterized protein LOC119550304 isoform X2 n=1 Tax=Drosophila subpulchrella TaxID=1486046 RepID=UPI0018A19B79|nr:uncharacterized protein LOC119550304 isoform X2 [Drosophila subpulchrella]